MACVLLVLSNPTSYLVCIGNNYIGMHCVKENRLLHVMELFSHSCTDQVSVRCLKLNCVQPVNHQAIVYSHNASAQHNLQENIVFGNYTLAHLVLIPICSSGVFYKSSKKQYKKTSCLNKSRIRSGVKKKKKSFCTRILVANCRISQIFCLFFFFPPVKCWLFQLKKKKKILPKSLSSPW